MLIRKPFDVSEEKSKQLREMLKAKPQVFSLEEEPVLGPLLTCLGLQFELKNKCLNRLNPYFEVPCETNWQSEIFSEDGNIGIRLWVEGVTQLMPKNKDFAYILDASSFDKNGILNELVIFPLNVYEHFRQMGMELVIVKDWVLDTFLCSEEDRVNYLIVNSHEVKSKTAMIHTSLVAERKFPFSGTHDIVDHLIAFNEEGFQQNLPIIKKANRVFAEIKDDHLSSMQLVVSYLVGVIVDDLAQPRWFGSNKHINLADILLDNLKSLKNSAEISLELPPWANLLIEQLRDQDKTWVDMEETFLERLN
ncbi:MAG: hypothetical protein HOO06_16330 [Bdellovibrionaceae bacterium]|jgi:hypothetical protein|nr:hypothetical protein [Pseudobdellovibrionaceae bacterium]